MKVLEERTSPINGKIKVVKSLGLGTYIQVDNLTQSGGVVHDIWKKALRKVKEEKKTVKTCLILGLGGGSAANLIQKNWPEVKITGVDIDETMVDLGKKYLGLDDVEIVIKDASEYCLEARKDKQQFDLILVDTYQGYEFPKEFEEKGFIKLVKDLLSKNGLVLFNRLYFDKKRKLAEVFYLQLVKVFNKVEPIYPEANVIYLCYN